MAKYKNIRVKKPNGGTRLQKVQVLASGKYKFVKNTKKLAKSLKSKVRSGVKKMARKRRRTYKKKTSKTTNVLGSMGRYLAPIAYGALRGKVSDFISNSSVGKQFPVTNYTDEALMFGGLMIAQKMGLAKSGIPRALVQHGKSIELARIGETLGKQGFNLMGTSKPQDNTMFNGGGY
jgi:hypothetical protein